MKLYFIPTGKWAATQAEAAAIAKADGTSWQRYDVPTDQTGLLAFLNDRMVSAEPGPPPATGQGQLVITHTQAPPPPPNPTYAAQVDRDITIEEAIADASYGRALSLASHIHSRLMEHARAAGGAK